MTLTHIPVLLLEVLSTLNPRPGERVLDCTLGIGGHAAAMLERIGATGEFVGLDADEENIVLAKNRLGSNARVQLIHADFRCVRELNLGMFDIIFADLGLSSPHLDDAARGFSFQRDGPLDMRFDRTLGLSAAELIKQSKVDDLAEIFRTYGELFRDALPLAHRMAGLDVPTTTALRTVVEGVVHWRAPRILPQVFQALRIAVNDELGALRILLEAAPTMLKAGGRLGMISFHSLEDRLVKHTMRQWTEVERDPITGQRSTEALFSLLTKKPIRPSTGEVEQNPRSRSALLRVVKKA